MTSEENSESKVNILDNVKFGDSDTPESLQTESTSENPIPKLPAPDKTDDRKNEPVSDSSNLEQQKNKILSGGGYGMYVAIFAVLVLIGAAAWYYFTHFRNPKDNRKRRNE